MAVDEATLTCDDVLVLQEDVAVPRPDRRAKYDWKLAETVPAGTKLAVAVELIPFDVDDKEFTVRRVYIQAYGRRGGPAVMHSSQPEDGDGPLVTALLAAADRTEATAAEIARESGWSAYALVRALERAGVVTADVMRRVIAEDPED
jgi:hypothetical protein